MEMMDHASPILAGDQTLTDEHRAALWDIFHSSKDPQELAQNLNGLPVNPDLKNQLMSAKQVAITPKGSDAVKDIISQMASMDPDALAIAEAHPQVLKTLVSAQAQAETQAPTTDDKKKKQQSQQQQKPQAVLAQRLDGKPHLPGIPDGHYRIQTSEGAIHDIPVEKIGEAQQIDPNLHVMNP